MTFFNMLEWLAKKNPKLLVELHNNIANDLNVFLRNQIRSLIKNIQNGNFYLTMAKQL